MSNITYLSNVTLDATPTADTDLVTKGYVDTGLSGKSGTSHTHSSLKNGAYTVSVPTLSANTYAVIQNVLAPVYSGSTIYYQGDICSHNGKLYMWINANSAQSITPPNSLMWREITTLTGLDASTTNKGLMKVGAGLSVSGGVVSVNPNAVQSLLGMGIYTKLSNMSTSTVELADDTAIYKYNIAGVTTLVFDVSNLSMTTGTAITFELYLSMPSTVYTITFPPSVSWLNNEIPSMSTVGKTYMFVFRSLDGGTTWLGSKEGAY